MEKRTLGKAGKDVTVFGFGGAETGFQGQAVAGRRNQFFLFTKCGHDKAGDHWNPQKMAAHPGRGQTRFIGYSGDGRAALYAVESGVFDTLQISVNIADQEGIDLAIPAARAKGMGIIAKRPIANAVWKHASKPDPYHQPYWERLPKLDYQFLKGDFQNAVSIALRFTLAAPGVHTAIAGTTQPDRWCQNAELLMKAGALEQGQFDEIHARWKSIAGADWNGQT